MVQRPTQQQKGKDKKTGGCYLHHFASKQTDASGRAVDGVMSELAVFKK